MTATAIDYTSPETLMELVRDPEAFETFFKKKAVDFKFGAGFWKKDTVGFRLVLPDGSYVRIKFFDTVKKIYNIKTNIEEPGRESFLSYLDVAVMPAGVKGYNFKMNNAQHVMGYAPIIPQQKHDASIAKLKAIAEAFGIDMTVKGAWETVFVG